MNFAWQHAALQLLSQISRASGRSLWELFWAIWKQGQALLRLWVFNSKKKKKYLKTTVRLWERVSQKKKKKRKEKRQTDHQVLCVCDADSKQNNVRKACIRSPDCFLFCHVITIMLSFKSIILQMTASFSLNSLDLVACSSLYNLILLS